MTSAVMRGSPEFLYRYRHLQGAHRGYTSMIFSDSVLYFASPRDFNDPFDSKAHFTARATAADIRRKYEQLLKTRRPELSRKDRRNKAAIDVKGVDRATFITRLTTDVQAKIDRLGILSLAATDNSLLLWSHYAAGHTGLCLKFRGDDGAPLFGRAQAVEYSNTYPQVDPVLDSSDRLVDALLLTKAQEWAYEEEWRIIDHQTGSGLKTFPSDCLVGVILGAAMPDADRRYVIDLVEKRKHRVEIKEAVVGEGAFSLEIRPYKL